MFDLHKAFDSLEWGFIDFSLVAWGFLANFGRLVLSCMKQGSIYLKNSFVFGQIDK